MCLGHCNGAYMRNNDIKRCMLGMHVFCGGTTVCVIYSYVPCCGPAAGGACLVCLLARRRRLCRGLIFGRFFSNCLHNNNSGSSNNNNKGMLCHTPRLGFQ